MKITKQKLKQIITEELKNVLNEDVTRYGQFFKSEKPQKSKPAKDTDLEDIRAKADDLERRRRAGLETGSVLGLRKDDLNKAIDNYKGPSKDKAEMFRIAADVPLAGGQSTPPIQYQYTDAAGTLPGPTSRMPTSMSKVDTAPLGDEVPGSRTASGPGGGGGAPTATTTKADTTKTKTKARKIRAGRHDVKFQRMLNRLEKAGKLSKSDYRKISSLNVMKKDPAGAKALYKQITGEDAPESATSTARAKTKPKKPIKIGGKEVDMTDGDLDADADDALTVKIPPKLKTRALRREAFKKGNLIRKQLKGQELRDFKTATVRMMTKFRRDYPLLAAEIPVTLQKLATQTAAFELGRADGKLDVFNVIMRDRKLKPSRKRLEKIWVRAARKVESELGSRSKENKRRELARYARELGFSERVASSE